MFIDNSIDSLVEPMKTKVKAFLDVVHAKFPNVAIFESRRTLSRQKWLKSMGKSWTMESKHLTGCAVDLVFLNSKGQPTWKGDYKYLHMVGFMCGLTPIYANGKLIESCHLQSDGLQIKTIMTKNSDRYRLSKLRREQNLLSAVNTAFRKYGYS